MPETRLVVLPADLVVTIEEYLQAGDEAFGPTELGAELVRLIEAGQESDDDFRDWADEHGPDLGTCPYFLKSSGVPKELAGLGAYGPATCAFGCTTEPECVTCEPSAGWPSWAPAKVHHAGAYIEVPFFLRGKLDSLKRYEAIADGFVSRAKEEDR